MSNLEPCLWCNEYKALNADLQCDQCFVDAEFSNVDRSILPSDELIDEGY